MRGGYLERGYMKNLFEYENKYGHMGPVAGTDEAGRGPLAGPVVCACVIMPLELDKLIDGVDDSKKLTPAKREMLYDKIIKAAVSYGISVIDREVIDEINILNATKLGMKEAYEKMQIKPAVLLTDAVKVNVPVLQQNIIHGDSLSYNIAAASILAKVTRDNIMRGYAKQYPQYNFEQHKGYGTPQHIEKLKQYGKCPIHRETFIKNFIS